MTTRTPRSAVPRATTPAPATTPPATTPPPTTAHAPADLTVPTAPTAPTAHAGPAVADADDAAPWRAFGRFWWLQVVAQLCSRSAQFVFPLIAVTSFGAGAAAVGVVNALQFLPVFAVSLALGGMIDHWDRKRAFVVAYLINVAAFAAVPAAAFAGLDPVLVLVAACAVVGTSIAFTDLCAQTMPPDLVPGRLLVRANSRMEVVYNAGQIAAPGFAGLAVQLLGGSSTLVLMAVLSAGSAVLASRLLLARRTVAADTPPLRARLTGAVDGVRILLGHRVLRVLTAQAAMFNLLEQAVLTLYLVYAVRTWGFSPGLVGVTITVGGVGTVLASLAFGVFGDRVRPVWALVGGMGVASLTPALIPLATGPAAVRAVWGAAAFFLFGLGMTAYNIFAVSLRQRLAPPGSLGRVSAGYRLLAFGPIAFGAVLGGAAGEWLGLLPALWITVAALAVCWAVFAHRALRVADRIEAEWATTR
ncbi:MAG TPA: MFS transporter [Pseudonocardiaceae bacterium]